MKREAVACLFLLGCTASSREPSVRGEAPAVADASGVPAGGAPTEWSRETSAADTADTPRPASARATPAEDPIQLTENLQCNTGRVPIYAMRLDESHECYLTFVAGCQPAEHEGISLASDDIRCAMKSTTLVFVGPSTTLAWLDPSWGTCSPDEQAMADGNVEPLMCSSQNAVSDAQSTKEMLQ